MLSAYNTELSEHTDILILKQDPHIAGSVCAQYIVCNGIKNQPNVNRICSLELQVHREPFHEFDLSGLITLSVSLQYCLQRLVERFIIIRFNLDLMVSFFIILFVYN